MVHVTHGRIAVVCDIDPFGGGSHQWALNILHALEDYRVERSTDVVVVHYGAYPLGHPLKELFPEFRFIRIGGIYGLITKVLRRFTILFPSALMVLRSMFPLNRVVSREAAGAVVFPVTGLDAALCSRRTVFCMADIAHVFYPDFPEVRAGNQRRLREVLFRYGLRNADRIMVESNQLKFDIAKYYDADVAKVHVIYQVLPKIFSTRHITEEQCPLPKPYLFYPAQLWAHKNHLNLLAAFASLHEEFPDLHLVLSGSRKPGDEVIFSKIGELGLTRRVIYLGYVPDGLMPELYRNAAALVLPTYFGPTNIPPLEAFAFGCPVIMSDLPGILEQVHEAALRFNPNDPSDIALKIRQLLTQPMLAARLVDAGRARLRELSFDNFRVGMFGLFDAALRRA